MAALAAMVARADSCAQVGRLASVVPLAQLMRYLVGALVSYLTFLAPVQAAPDLDAVITYEMRQVLASGITRTETWKEQLVRRGGSVWTQRVLPNRGHSDKAHGGTPAVAHRKHFNYETAGRWLQIDSKGETQLRFIDAERKMLVTIPKTEFASVGFDGRWDAAAHLLPPSLLKTMQASGPSAQRDDSVWFTQGTGEWQHRVRWSTVKQVALRIESTRADGSLRRTVLVEPVTPRKLLPWQGTTDYEQKTFDDFLD